MSLLFRIGNHPDLDWDARPNSAGASGHRRTAKPVPGYDPSTVNKNGQLIFRVM